MIQMCKKTKKIYGVHNGMSYEYLDKKSWVPCLHMPVGGMTRLCKKAYPTLHQSFSDRFCDTGNMCLAIRLQTGMDQEQFAKMLDMTQQSISRLETGTRNETKIQGKLFHCVEILNDAGLLGKLR